MGNEVEGAVIFQFGEKEAEGQSNKNLQLFDGQLQSWWSQTVPRNGTIRYDDHRSLLGRFKIGQ